MCKYLVLRKSTYHFQQRVPKDLQEIEGKKAIKMSLRIGDKREANRIAQQIAKQNLCRWNKLRANKDKGLDPVEFGRHLRAFIDRHQAEDAKARIPRSRKPYPEVDRMRTDLALPSASDSRQYSLKKSKRP